MNKIKEILAHYEEARRLEQEAQATLNAARQKRVELNKEIARMYGNGEIDEVVIYRNFDAILKVFQYDGAGLHRVWDAEMLMQLVQEGAE